MILIDNGMAKSGSTLLMAYASSLLTQAYPRNGQDAFRAAVVDGRLPGIHDYMNAPTATTLPILEQIHQDHGPLVIKTHTDVNDFLLEALRDGRVVMFTSHRDPRDMLLSAMDHAKRSLAEGRPVFQEFTDVTSSIPHARWWATMALHWIESGLSLPIRYADLLSDPRATLRRLADHAQLPVTGAMIEHVIADELQQRRPGINQFNQGSLTRFREVLSPEELKLCNEGLGDIITALGYSI